MKTRILLPVGLAALIIVLFSATAVGWNPYGPPPLMGPGGGWQDRALPLRVDRSADADHYYVTISTGDLDPQAVTVSVEGGRRLVIGRADTTQTSEEKTPEGGSDYYYRSYSYSYSSRTASRQILLPRDADGAAMTREDSPGQVRVTIPRRR